MAENKLYFYSSSPHVKSKTSTRFIMGNVCIALLPTLIAGTIFFGWMALLFVAISVASAILSELVYLLICKKTFKYFMDNFDFTSIVTGLLVGLSLGVNYPLYAGAFGSAFAIIVVKMLFGGTGKNIVNPAVAGRIFVFISFQSIVGKWIVPGGELITGATTLTNLFQNGFSGNLLDLFLGVGLEGCIGETCKLALILGAIYLAILKIIDIRLPLIYVAVTGLFQTCLMGFDFNLFLPSILSGGLILGAFFMATDYVTTPNTKIGNYVYFVALGLVTAGLRVATGMEVVSFAILLMNLFVPLIDKFIRPRPFGFKKTSKGGGK